jgi:hypothetical protein
MEKTAQYMVESVEYTAHDVMDLVMINVSNAFLVQAVMKQVSVLVMQTGPIQMLVCSQVNVIQSALRVHVLDH